MSNTERGLHCKKCGEDLEFDRLKATYRSETEWFMCMNGHNARLTYDAAGYLIGMVNVGGINP